MRRVVSIFMMCCLLLGIFPTTALAANDPPGNEVTVNLYRSGPSAAADYTVTLKSSSEFKDTLKAPVVNSGTDKSFVTLRDIPNGTYTLTVSAKYHVTYTQELTINNASVMLNLCNSRDMITDSTKSKYGLVPVGDINSDGKISDEDATLVLESNSYDLTGNGETDLQDLALVVRNQGELATAPVSNYTVPKAEAADSTKMEGDSSTGLTLTPTNGTPISQENPVTINLTPPSSNKDTEGIVIAAPKDPKDSKGVITQGEITVATENDETFSYSLNEEQETPRGTAKASAPGEITKEADGTIVIDFGKRVAVKKVTIKVTGTASSALAEIAKVEFFQDFANRIPAPKLDIPTVTAVSNTESDGLGYKNLTVSWTAQQNVTGYEVSVSGPGYSKTANTEKTSYTFEGDSFNGTVQSFQTYTIKVRSLNGSWKSDWSKEYSHTVTCTQKPPAPESVKVTPGVQSLRVSWVCKFDAESYSLFYKKSSDSSFQEKKDLESSSHTLTGLEGGTEYTVYVVAHNRNGDSPKSQNAVGMPTTPTGAELPKYKILDNSVIKSISGNPDKGYTIYKADGSTVTNANATPEDWRALLDDNPSTHLLIPDWDSGVKYDNFRGPILQLDQKRTLDTIRMTPSEGASVHMAAVKIRYKDEKGAFQEANAKFSQQRDKQGRLYYEAVLDSPITTDYLEVRTSSLYGSEQNYTICELRLYEYDDLEAKVKDLFADPSHTTLKDHVKEETIQNLIDRANTKDEKSQEYHPHQETILNDLNYAMKILKDGKPGEALTVDNQITATEPPASGFAQELSDYQPLGYVAQANSTITVYVSDLTGQTSPGSKVNLELVATQYHPEVSAWQASPIQLKAGRNEINIPKIGSSKKEAGGTLYLRYTGEKGANQYEVRVIGGTEIPVLRLDGITGEERTAAIKAYVTELESYVKGLSNLHNSTHQDIGYNYDDKECFLNATEITMENMMFSVPATQVWAAISGGDAAHKLEQSIEAMEQEIDYFYQFKGLNKAATDNDAYPNTRLNIRYHQMFTGAFMYAGGKHIGIEYGSVPGLFQTTPVTTDGNGKKTGGSYSGWGIAHEIGHCINAASYQRVEVTNNLFPQLAQTDETNKTSRVQDYNQVYKAVVTGTTGHTGNLAVQLAMYWQLHLAYDNDYSFKVYDSIQAQQDGLFYARLESYLRTPSKAEPDLQTTSGDQGFMQAACAAAGKNILPFFQAWGIIPNEQTKAYAANFGAETRKIQYIDDDSRLYRLENKPGMSKDTTVTASITNAKDSRINGNKVELSLSNNNQNENAMLGYEIARNGKVVAFVPASKDSYTDIVTTENNKAFTYTVTGIDRLLNETDTVTLDEVKVCHDGAIDKSAWTATTNMVSDLDTTVDKDDEDPDSGTSTTQGAAKQSAIGLAIDNKTDTVYYGTKSGSERPYVVLNLGGVQQITALKFTPDAGDHSSQRLFGYRVEISMDGNNWTTVKEGNCYADSASSSDPGSWKKQEDIIYNDDGSYTLFFNKKTEDGSMDPYLYTYDAAYVKLTATTMSSLAIAELDVLGPTSDNVELLTEGYGKLKENFTPTGADEVALEAGTIVFYGSYKGDPSYNIVVLRDQDGKMLDGESIILAHVADKGYLGETSDGRWIYGIQKENMKGVTKVIAELYRVQDATVLKGERLTSTSLHMTIPENCPDVTLKGNNDPIAAHVEDTSLLTLKEEEAATSTAGEAQPVADFYGDTGAVHGSKSSRVTLTPDGNKMKFEAKQENGSIAMQIDFKLSPAPASVDLTANNDNNVFQTHRYDKASGNINLYVVQRSGTFTNGSSIGSINDLDRDTKVSATTRVLKNLSSQVSNSDDSTSTEGTIGSGTKPPSHGSNGNNQTFTLKFQTNGGSALQDVTKKSGTSVDLTAYLPKKEGYTFAGWYADAALTKKVTSVKLTSNTTVYAKWTKTGEVPNFVDVPADAWYLEDLQFVYTNGIMMGTSDTHFSPDRTTSRGMLVTTLYRMEGEPEPTAENPFADVVSNAYYEKAVRWAFANHIVTGHTATQFSPDGSITREQMATILYRYAQYKGRDTSPSVELTKYSDAAQIHEYTLPAMRWACATGLMNGTSSSTLSPLGSATRAQVAALLHRF